MAYADMAARPAIMTVLYKITKAAWPYFLKQGYGRVVNTTSTSGIYGNFGQANYAAAVRCLPCGLYLTTEHSNKRRTDIGSRQKLGILGFCDALARKCATSNIFVNTIAP